LQGVPTAIVHGRLDLVCRPANAWRVHQTLHGSRLRFVDGCGHHPFVPAMARTVTGAIDHFAAHGDFAGWGMP
jgi:proline iminopeptidase